MLYLGVVWPAPITPSTSASMMICNTLSATARRKSGSQAFCITPRCVLMMPAGNIILRDDILPWCDVLMTIDQRRAEVANAVARGLTPTPFAERICGIIADRPGLAPLALAA
jgi:hypothetical protein